MLLLAVFNYLLIQ